MKFYIIKVRWPYLNVQVDFNKENMERLKINATKKFLQNGHLKYKRG